MKKPFKDFSHKLEKKKNFDGNLVKFSRQFLEELTKNCTETLNNFGEILRKNLVEIWGALENVSGRFKA